MIILLRYKQADVQSCVIRKDGNTIIIITEPSVFSLLDLVPSLFSRFKIINY